MIFSSERPKNLSFGSAPAATRVANADNVHFRANPPANAVDKLDAVIPPANATANAMREAYRLPILGACPVAIAVANRAV
jgi:hypothetical protein